MQKKYMILTRKIKPIAFLQKKHWFVFLIILLVLACTEDPPVPNQGNNEGSEGGAWAVPREAVINDTSAFDRIPSIDSPRFKPAKKVQDLLDDSKVLIYKKGITVKIYPFGPLSSHEIVNDETNGASHAVTFCPITASGVNWNREIDGKVTTFGVSGMLYLSNLMPYDRETRSIWSQMLLMGVHGKHIRKNTEMLPLLETTWKTAREMFPNSLVLNTSDSTVCEECQPKDGAPSGGEKFYGIPGIKQAYLISYESFQEELSVLKEHFNNRTHLIAGSKQKHLISVFALNAPFDDYQYEISENGHSTIFKDNQGNHYNAFGEIISGPDKGKALNSAQGFTAKYFAWKDFYPDHVFVEP